MTAMGVLCCFALFVCLTLLASFFLLMRDEKEERSKQGQTNKQGKATQHTHTYMTMSLVAVILKLSFLLLFSSASKGRYLLQVSL